MKGNFQIPRQRVREGGERGRQTDRQRQRETEAKREGEREGGRKTERKRERDRDTERDRDRQTDRPTFTVLSSGFWRAFTRVGESRSAGHAGTSIFTPPEDAVVHNCNGDLL